LKELVANNYPSLTAIETRPRNLNISSFVSILLKCFTNMFWLALNLCVQMQETTNIQNGTF